MGEIKQGLKAGVDVSKYADPRFGLSRMALIRRGLEEGPDVSKYARNLKFDFGQLNVIWRGYPKVKMWIYTQILSIAIVQ